MSVEMIKEIAGFVEKGREKNVKKLVEEVGADAPSVAEVAKAAVLKKKEA